jgi:hypothetical protein
MAAKKRAKKASKKVVRKAATRSARTTTKKTSRKAATAGATIRQGDKAAFVRGLSRSMPASEVVERAAAKNMIISKAYVHNIRSAANKAARALMAKEGKKTLKGGKKRLESQFRELVISLGPARAKKLLAQVETSLAIAAKNK